MTSADCASRVPYCSELGFCHGGRLPFDEEQLEIDSEVFQQDPNDQPQGYINNNPPKNSPYFTNSNNKGNQNNSQNRNQNRRNQNQNSPRRQQNQNSQNRQQNPRNQNRPEPKSNSNTCPGQSVQECIESACNPLKSIQRVFEACSKSCNKRC